MPPLINSIFMKTTRLHIIVYGDTNRNENLTYMPVCYVCVSYTVGAENALCLIHYKIEKKKNQFKLTWTRERYDSLNVILHAEG